MLGTSEPVSRTRYGRFRREGKRFFLAIHGDAPPLLLELDRARASYDAVAVSVPDAAGIAARIEAARL